MKNWLVVLDPGHGGWDTGIQTAMITEKEVALTACFALREALQAAGVEVRLTREDDRELTAAKRAELANRPEVDLFISWHCDALEDRSVSGVSLWVAEERPEQLQWMGDFEVIGEEMCEASGQILLGVFQDHEKVLEEVTRPAVVIKSAFLSHAIEAELCTQQAFLQLQASGAARGILNVLNSR